GEHPDDDGRPYLCKPAGRAIQRDNWPIRHAGRGAVRYRYRHSNVADRKYVGSAYRYGRDRYGLLVRGRTGYSETVFRSVSGRTKSRPDVFRRSATAYALRSGGV